MPRDTHLARLSVDLDLCWPPVGHLLPTDGPGQERVGLELLAHLWLGRDPCRGRGLCSNLRWSQAQLREGGPWSPVSSVTPPEVLLGLRWLGLTVLAVTLPGETAGGARAQRRQGGCCTRRPPSPAALLQDRRAPQPSLVPAPLGDVGSGLRPPWQHLAGWSVPCPRNQGFRVWSVNNTLGRTPQGPFRAPLRASSIRPQLGPGPAPAPDSPAGGTVTDSNFLDLSGPSPRAVLASVCAPGKEVSSRETELL